MEILSKINSPDDIKQLNEEELPILCDEIREFLTENVSKTGGHLSSNLGVVELTVAIHRVFDTTSDRLVFDVGHQSYVHKILTGRRDKFHTLRQFGGIAGFPKPAESEHDAFIAGHASNSISVALGIARARTRQGKNYSVIALIGDGALTGGLSYEALNDAGESGEPLIVILNDNGMAIDSNVGGISRHLAQLRLKPGYLSFKKAYRRVTAKIPGGKAIYRFTHNVKTMFKQAALHCSMFEDMGFHYLGPVDGHDLSRMTELLSWARELNEPVIIHAITKKGKGYAFSEENPDEYHGVSKFDAETGVEMKKEKTFSSVFGEKLLELAQNDVRICAITAAMASGTGLIEFEKNLPDRFFDVGIAEAHGAALAAGAAKQGMLPVFAVYSTFLQRAYDMLLHDTAISDLHVVFGVDRAGLVNGDGETHHGVFDVAYLSSVPNMTVLCPASFNELQDMLEFALFKLSGPVAIRYPRGGEGEYKGGGVSASKLLREGVDITVVTHGIITNTALKAAEMLAYKGIEAEIIKLDFVNPLDMRAIKKSVRKTGRLLVLEECVSAGSAGERIAANLMQSGIALKKVILKNLGSGFVTHGSREDLLRMCEIDAESVAKAILEEFPDEQDEA